MEMSAGVSNFRARTRLFRIRQNHTFISVTSTRIIQLAAWVLGIGVAIGAFGAHALADLLVATGRQDTFETAVRYQMYHGLALLALGLAGDRLQVGVVVPVVRLFALGIILFSGSLYALCLLQLPILGAVTPLGGVCFIAGWVWLAFKARINN